MYQLAIPFAFLLLAIVLLWLLVLARGLWWIKTVVVTATLLFAVAVYYGVESYLGYPFVSEDLPDHFQIHYVIIKEPSKTNVSQGKIYLWISAISIKKDESQGLFKISLEGEPRSYQVKYTRKSQEQMEIALKMIREGKPVFGGKGKGKKGKGQGDPLKDGLMGDEDFSLSRGGEFYFGELAPSYFIPKAKP